MALEVDPMSAASPDMTTAEMAALKESIATHGQLVPIVVHGDHIIDGRKRFAVCQELGIEPKTVSVPVDGDATVFAGALNLFRTHYSVSQRAMYGSALANIRHGFNRHTARVDREISRSTKSPANPRSVKEVATALSVPRSAIAEAKVVRRDGIPEVTQAAERGQISVYAAKIIAGAPKPEQAGLLTKALAAKADGKNMPPNTLVPRREYRPKPKPSRVIPRVIEQLETHADTLEEFWTDPPPDGPHGEWHRSLGRVLTIVARVRKKLKQEEATA